MDKPKRKRSTDHELQERISKALTLYRMGHPTTKICKLLMDSEGISLRTAERALKVALESIDALGSQSTVHQRGKLLARIEYIYAATIIGQDKNFDQALKALTLESKLLPKSESPIKNPKGAIHEPTEPAPTSGTPLSPELQRILKRVTPNHPTQSQLPDVSE